MDGEQSVVNVTYAVSLHPQTAGFCWWPIPYFGYLNGSQEVIWLSEAVWNTVSAVSCATRFTHVGSGHSRTGSSIS
jgi:hypothetical protein